ncbi:MAG: acyl-CoA dehydrogenase family protein [Deltaproteobacteria bacterium]|nr:acyl-CoA dehydrogenase family protein [Deltaproteobacteria bacterium]
MRFELTEDQQLIRDAARRLADTEIKPGAAARDKSCEFPLAPMKALAQNGFLAMLVPEAHGGSGASSVAYALALSEVARACASTAVTMAVTNMVADAIDHFGNDEQRSRYIPRLANGDSTAGAFALSEPGAGSDAASLTLRAEKRSGRYALTGSKCWITSGDRAGVVLVMARTGGPGARGISAFLVRPDAKGFSVGKHEEKMGLRASSTVTLSFDDVEVPEEDRLGDEGVGFKIAMRALDGGRIGIGAQANGIHLACLEAARTYALDRKQFGRPIAEFQAMQWKLADMATSFDAARLLVLRAASLKDSGQPFTREASMAKVFSTEAANKAALEAIQIHGGYGYTGEFPVERYLRDVRVSMIYEGTSEIQRVVLARQLLAT